VFSWMSELDLYEFRYVRRLSIEFNKDVSIQTHLHGGVCNKCLYFLQHDFVIRFEINDVLVIGYCYGVVSYKASHALQQFSDLLCPKLSSNYS
jgi:hypothetical protein